ncbi:MAG TPA: ABC transporter substrate-binding protein [Pyrinomonadaceae bacterium]|jgi:iron complex transport system substrate-binding protein|nr:ABC transporter substrate-binding protein [Pyrinomonadaceae bacterium]
MKLRKKQRRVDVPVAVSFMLVTLVALAASAFVACGDAVYVETGKGAKEAQGGATTAAGQPQRIISLSPSTTEVLYGVGAFERVVAVSDYDKFPPEVSRLPKIGGWSNTNLEQVATLKPDLIIMTSSQAPLIKDKLDALDVRTVTVPSYTVADALKSIEQIGAVTGREEAARQLAAEVRAKLEDVRGRTRELPRVRVLCIVDRVPGTLRGLYTATRGSFFAELIEIAGGESIAPPASNGFGQISKEAVVTLNPDIIFDMLQSGDGKLAENTQEVWRELGSVRAVREGRVYKLNDESMLHPSQFVGDTARKFAELIHPAAFGAKAQ